MPFEDALDAESHLEPLKMYNDVLEALSRDGGVQREKEHWGATVYTIHSSKTAGAIESMLKFEVVHETPLINFYPGDEEDPATLEITPLGAATLSLYDR